MAGLLEILKRHNLPIPEDYDDRVGLIVACLKSPKNCKHHIDKFKKTKGGAEAPLPAVVQPPPKALEAWDEKEKGPYPPVSGVVPPRFFPDNTDYLGPRLKWFLKATSSPYAPRMFEALFMVIFLLSYLESIPVFGSILSAALDVMLSGGKALLKMAQTSIPPMFGAIPLPYTYMIGFGLSAMLGMLIWPIFAIIATSRQDFVMAIESWIRVVPPPVGDILANNFLEANRMVARIDEKRVKLGNDISKGLTALSNAASQISSAAKAGLLSLSQQVSAAAQSAKATVKNAVAVPPQVSAAVQSAKATVPVPPQGGFHKRTRRNTWRTARHKSARR
jgi:hypothetical protein